MKVHREDYRAVRPTPEEIADWDKRYPNRKNRQPTRAEHLPCGKRIWYSGMAIASHDKACWDEQFKNPNKGISHECPVCKAAVGRACYADPERSVERYVTHWQRRVLG